MPFGTITAQTVSYEPRTPGTYSKAAVTFGQPKDEFRLTGGRTAKSGSVNSAITRLVEKDVTVGDDQERHSCVVTLSVSIPSTGSFTAAEVDSLATDISEFMTTDTVNRLLQGEI